MKFDDENRSCLKTRTATDGPTERLTDEPLNRWTAACLNPSRLSRRWNSMMRIVVVWRGEPRPTDRRSNGTTDRWTAEPPPVWIRLVLKIMSWEGKETRNSAGSTCLMFHVSCMMYDDWWLIIDVCYDQNRCLLLNSLFILHSFNHSYLQIWRGIFLPLTRIPVGKASLFTFTLMLILRFSMRRMA